MSALADTIDALLPQTQCTKCGYPSCRRYAEAVAAGEADFNQCPPAGAAGIRELASLLGRDAKPLNPANGVERNRRIAVIATNTTVSRAGVEHLPSGGEQGGLSGAPLKARATEVVGKLRRALPETIAIIGVGGIASAADAREKLDAGASLVQLYTALVYRGPELVGEIVRGLAAR